MARPIGIDFGTTASAVAVVLDGKPIVVGNSEGTRLTPSAVAFTKDGQLLVGAAAKRRAIISPDNAVCSIKRFLGRRFAEVEAERKLMSFRIQEGPDGSCRIRIRGQDYSPEELAAQILSRLKCDAEEAIGAQATDAVITVPVDFNHAQRQALKDAAAIAGLNVLSLITDTAAAALTYSRSLDRETTVLFLDAGGGNISASIVKASNGHVEVLASAGDSHLGGDDFDAAIALWLENLFATEEGIDLTRDPQALQRLIEGAEKAKSELSYEPESDISLPFLTANSTGPKHLDTTLTAAGFRDLTLGFVPRVVCLIDHLSRASNVQLKDIEEVIMVGNSSRVPWIQQLVEQITHKQPKVVGATKEMVALGAALYGASLAGVAAQSVTLHEKRPEEPMQTAGVCLAAEDVAVLAAKYADTTGAEHNLRTRADTRSEADTLCYAADRQLKEAGNGTEWKRTRQALVQLKTGLKANVDTLTLSNYMEELRLALQALVEQQACGRTAPATPLRNDSRQY